VRHTYVVLCCVKDEEDHGQWTGVGLTRNAGSSASSANHAFECSQGRRRRQAAATALEPESSVSVGTRSKRVDARDGHNYFITETLLILLESKENVAAEGSGCTWPNLWAAGTLQCSAHFSPASEALLFGMRKNRGEGCCRNVVFGH
jgi:hypothetical protein